MAEFYRDGLACDRTITTRPILSVFTSPLISYVRMPLTTRHALTTDADQQIINNLKIYKIIFLVRTNCVPKTKRVGKQQLRTKPRGKRNDYKRYLKAIETIINYIANN